MFVRSGSESISSLQNGDSAPAELDALAEDSSGVFWIGSRQAGLYRFDPATTKLTAFRHSGTGQFKRRWSDFRPGGSFRSRLGWNIARLSRLDPQTGKFTTYLARDGLPGSLINGIVEDSSGDLWITTSYGLSHFNPRSRTFYNYYRPDGVFDDLTGAWRGRSGKMFFGSYSGLTVLSPELIEEKRFRHKWILTDFKISDQSVPIGEDAPLKQSISVTKALTLSHNQNTFSFQFAALSYADPERTRYRYRLERLENKWNEVTGTQNFARYPLIAPGKYAFHVEAWTPRGNWTEPGTEVRIVILPPWWSTWWFRLAASSHSDSRRCLLPMAATRSNRAPEAAFEERLAERTRIARDSPRYLASELSSCTAELSRCEVHGHGPVRGPEEAIEDVIDQARHAITEGRNAIEGSTIFETRGLGLGGGDQHVCPATRSSISLTRLPRVSHQRRGSNEEAGSDPRQRALPHCGRSATQRVPDMPMRSASK